MTFNEVKLIGWLGNDCKVIGEATGAQFSLATKEVYTNKKGEKVENTDWHNVKAWGKVGEFCAKYLKKGSYCFVNGKLKNNKWKDENDQTRYSTDVIIEKIIPLSKKEFEEINFSVDEIPF